MRSEVFRHVERELYLYKFYRAALTTVLWPSVSSSLGDTNTRVQHSAGEGATASMGSRRAEYRMKVEAIERGVALLTDQERQFYQFRYLTQLPYDVICREMHISKETACRIRRRVLSRFAVMLGLVWAEEEAAAVGEP